MSNWIRLNSLRLVASVVLVSSVASRSIAADSTARSATCILDLQHLTALRHLLQSSKPDDAELLSLTGVQLQAFDEFAQRRKLQEARASFQRWTSEVAAARKFQIRVVAELGPYDFDRSLFPVILPESLTCRVVTQYSSLWANSRISVLEKVTDTSTGRESSDGSNTILMFSLPEEVRMLPISQKKAESLMPRINSYNRKISIEVTFDTRATLVGNDCVLLNATNFVALVPQGYGTGDKLGGSDAWTSWLRMIQAHEDALSGSRNGKNNSAPKPPASTVLASWGSPWKLRWVGPRIEGVWRGASKEDLSPSSMTQEHRSKTVEYLVTIHQSRKIVYGNFHYSITEPDTYYPTQRPPSHQEDDESFEGASESAASFIVNRTVGGNAGFKARFTIASRDQLVVFLPTHFGDPTPDDFHISLDRLPSPHETAASQSAPSRPSQVLSGDWTGTYSAAGSQTTAGQFTIHITQEGQNFGGEIEETSILPNASKVQVRATVPSGTLFSDGHVSMTKQYSGALSSAPPISYEGSLSADGRSMSGTWTIPRNPRTGAESLSGTFQMNRQK